MKLFFVKIGQWFAGVFKNLFYRLKPRVQVRWILTFIFWVALIVYVGFGIYLGINIYSFKSESKITKIGSNYYPFPAAIVGSNVVWAKTYYTQLAYIRQFTTKTQQSVPEAPALRSQIINQLIENRLIEFEALKNGVSVSKKDVDDAYQKIVNESGGDANVQKVLNDLYGMNQKQFKSLIKDQVLKEKVQNDLIAQVKILHILIKDEKRANDIAQKAKNGEAWDQLAKTYSEDIKTRDDWGSLGWIARGNLTIDGKKVPEFEDAAFSAKIGEIFGPIKGAAGYQIGKVEDKKGKIDMSYDDWVASLKKNSKIIIFIK